MLTSEWKPAIVGFCFNSFVHVIMYYYYALVARKIRVWWKQLITTLQIIQFVFCFVLLYFSIGTCVWDDRTWIGLASTNTLYLSYLLLFIHFYLRTYIGKAKKTGDARAANKTAKAADAAISEEDDKDAASPSAQRKPSKID